MKSPIIYICAALAGLLLTACEKSTRERLQELKAEMIEMKSEIKELETKLAKEDTAFAATIRRSVLITTLPSKRGRFTRFVEANGTVMSRTNIVVSPEMAGVIQKISVVEGQTVQAGQVIARLDDAMIRSQIEELNTSLRLANTVLEKRERLWQQKIGTEIQYLEAKTNKESLERSIRTLETQLAKSEVKAPISGRVEEVIARAGELAQPGLPMLRIVSTADVYLKADISEAYLGKFHPGDSVRVFFPELNRELTARLRTIGTVINPANRTFTVEVSLPGDPNLSKPGLMAVMHLKEFDDPVAITVPSHLVQQDLKGEFVYVMSSQSAQPVALKVRVKRGPSYKNETVIEEGLTGGELLVDEGFREVVDGAKVRVHKTEETQAQQTSTAVKP